jgi:hypothetical protein
MFLNKLMKSGNNNFSDFSNLTGRKFYYSKTTSFFTIILNVIGLILLIVLPILLNELKLFYINAPLAFITIYYLNKAIGHYKYKNPIFIFNNEELFYSKKSQWYVINDFDIKEIVNRSNYFYRYIRMREKNGNIIFTEANWYIANSAEIYKEIQKAHLKRIWRIKNENK